MKKALKYIYDKLVMHHKPLLFHLNVDNNSSFNAQTNLNNQKIQLNIANNSRVSIGKNVVLSGNITLCNNCELIICDDCILTNIVINIVNNGVFVIKKGCIMDIPLDHPSSVFINNGKLFFEEKVHNKASILVRFGGQLDIGMCTDIGYGTEIRCEEKITIGEYCLFSYDVCIYDTNTHSTDSERRRALYDKGYPFGADEIERPETKPIIIGNDVWLGKQSTVLKGAVIGNKSIVGIRTIVPSGFYKDNSRIVSSKPLTV